MPSPGSVVVSQATPDRATAFGTAGAAGSPRPS